MRLIDADKLVYDKIQNVFGDFYLVVHAPKIEKAPTVEAEPIIRCKDCKRRNTALCAIAYYDNLGHFNNFVKDNDYCSYAERKDDRYGEIHRCG